MGVGDVLSSIGSGLAGVGKAAGRAVQEFAPEIGTALRGDAGEVAYEQRQHQYTDEEREREVRADELERQLEAGRKYGTLTPDQQQQLVRDITGIYPKAQHAPRLMDRLHRIAKGGAAAAPAAPPQVPVGIPGAFPAGGTAQIDADLRAQARPMNPKVDFLNRLATEQGVGSFAELNSDQQAAALTQYEKAATKAAVENITTEALNKFTQDNYGHAYKEASSEEQLAAIHGVANAHVVQRQTTRTGVDEYGVPRTSTTVSGPVGGVPAPPATQAPASQSAPASAPAKIGGVLPKKKAGGAAQAPASAADKVSNRDTYKAVVKAWGAGLNKTVDESNQVKTRLTTMEQSADLAKQGDGPAQVAIIANYIKTVVGGSGVRVTQAEWNQATGLAPWLQRVEAHFTDDGFVEFGKNPISTEQVDSMVREVRQKNSALQDRLQEEMSARPKLGDLLKQPAAGSGGGKSAPAGKKIIVVKPEDMN